MQYNKAFSDLHESARDMGEANDCAVKAIAVAGGIGYAEAHALLRRHGRIDRKGTYTPSIDAALEELGIEQREVTPTMRASGGRTVRTLVRLLRGRRETVQAVVGTETFLVYTRGHVLTVKDGQCVDWTDGRLHRVRRVMALHASR